MPFRDHFRSADIHGYRRSGLYGMWPPMLVRELFDILPEGYRSAPVVRSAPMFGGDIHPNQNATDDEYEVLIYDAGRRLVAAIEIVSPTNRDRPASRQRFVDKVAALLGREVGVSIIDMVTVCHFNLYADLLKRVGRRAPQLAEDIPHTYAATLRPRPAAMKPFLLDCWFYPLKVGDPMPSLPIWLDADRHVQLPLESGYEETCRLLHIR